MSCNGCTGNKNNELDRHGNIVNSQQEKPKNVNSAEEQARNMTYQEFKQLKLKKEHDDRTLADEHVATLSDDYKRIQIHQMVDMWNADMFGGISPRQALRVLWEFAHHKDYQKVIDEFTGLREMIDLKYKELENDKIKLVWKQ